MVSGTSDRWCRWGAVAVLLLAARLGAQETVVELDPARTKIEFTLAASLHTVHGSFRLKRGSIRFDPATGKAGGEIVADAASGNSGNGSRDGKMHKSVLESARYPEISFTPDAVSGAMSGPGPWHVQVHGEFRIHGAVHELTVPAEAQAAPDRFTATLRFAVPYVQWGMRNPSNFLLRVDEKVTIEVHAVGRVISGETKGR
jgi:polyisoprenoid-binding protein YceI